MACAFRCSSNGPAFIKPGTISNEIISLIDWMPTLVAAAGEPNVVEKLQNGYDANGRKFKIHADGYNFLPYFKGETKKGPREEIFYFGQGGELNAVRWNDWKANFAGVDGNIATGTRKVTGWPILVNLRADPYEKMPFQSGMYIRWYGDNLWLFVPVQQKLKGFLSTITQYPVPGGLQPERSEHQLYDAQGDGGSKALAGVGGPSGIRGTDTRISRRKDQHKGLPLSLDDGGGLAACEMPKE